MGYVERVFSRVFIYHIRYRFNEYIKWKKFKLCSPLSIISLLVDYKQKDPEYKTEISFVNETKSKYHEV